jgi:hypothetical protein
MLKKLNDLKKERDKITLEINKIYHKLFATFFNNELKLYEKKDKMYYVDHSNRSGIFNLSYELSEEIIKWLNKNNIELKLFNFNGVMIEIYQQQYCSTRIYFQNKATEISFSKTYTVEA